MIIIAPCIALAVALWAANHQRIVWRWVRDGCNGPLPSLRKLR